ncbi:uncharacterized protein LOC144709447 [Wolffia australiana]
MAIDRFLEIARKSQRVLADAAKLTRKSWRPMILYMFIFLVYFLLQQFAYTVAVYRSEDCPFRTVLSMARWKATRGEFNAILPRLLEDFLTLEKQSFVLFLPTFLLTVFLQNAAITSLAMRSRGEKLDVKGHLLTTMRNWKHAMVTVLYKDLITTSFLFYSVGFITAIGVIFDFSAWSFTVAQFIVTLAFLLALYLDMLLNLGVVITVAEEGGFGLSAIGRASELIQGFLLGTKHSLLIKVCEGLIMGFLAFYCQAVDVEFYKECRPQNLPF